MTGDILYLGRVPWDWLYQRPQHLAAGLARHFRVLYVDTPRSTFYRRVIRPLRQGRPVRPLLWQPLPGLASLSVLSPPYLPFITRHWPPAAHYVITRALIRWTTRRLGMTGPILWAADPRDTYVLDALPFSLLCYDCMDDYPLLTPLESLRSLLAEQEIAILRRADVVFASSQHLAAVCARRMDMQEGVPGKRVIVVPNAVDPEVFSASAAPVPADLAVIPRPRLGMMGLLAPWVDLDLVAAVARARPQWHIVLVGPTRVGHQAAVAALKSMPNIHVLGERPYESIPGYVRNFDVCLIPFKANHLTAGVDPVKFYEYMAAGRPVVANGLPELEQYASVCRLAETGEDFIRKIEECLAEEQSGEAQARAEERRALARANTWDQRVQTISEALLLEMARRGDAVTR